MRENLNLDARVFAFSSFYLDLLMRMYVAVYVGGLAFEIDSGVDRREGGDLGTCRSFWLRKNTA